MMSIKIIVALDFQEKWQALNLVNQLNPKLCALKVGSEMFTKWGPAFVKELITLGFNVFLDLKFHDIPNTVSQACLSAADLGVWMITIHAMGGFSMMQAAAKALAPYGDNKPLLMAVTVLTSFNDKALSDVGVSFSLPQQVQHLAVSAKAAGLDGVVSSAYEVKSIKQQLGSPFLIVTPGIRLADSKQDDQCRIMTPKQAIEEGSDFLVIGRPITQAADPKHMLSSILQQIDA